jgi:exopolysaccharide biosynthesis predicted pyruvyltransferase EpsI
VGTLARPTEVEASRQAILDEIGDPPDLTLVLGYGNVGDQLIRAGTQELLIDHIFDEVHVEELPGASGHTVLLPGGGAYCRAYHEFMPRTLALAQLRFERVIVLPTSFDPSLQLVREALMRTRATVFAREPESFRRIVSLCDARLAHDCAFFYDYSPWRRSGSGTLNAFRTDREAAYSGELPADNQDISETARGLDEFLETIAAHELVRTDRAHVMIPAALLGKRVEFAPNTYHKVAAIARHSLADYDVTPIPTAPSAPAPRRSVRPRSRRPPQLTAVVVTCDQPGLALATIDSLLHAEVSVGAIVLDNNSADRAWRELESGCAEREHVRLLRSDRDLGDAGNRLLALEHVDTELVLLLEADVVPPAGAVDRLIAELDTDAVVDGGALLVKRSLLEEFPLDPQMTHYWAREWCYRVEQRRPGSLRRAGGQRPPTSLTGVNYISRSLVLELLLDCARFYARHGTLLTPEVFDLVPELSSDDAAAAKLLMELLLAKGTDWVFMQWSNGELDVLLGASGRAAERERANAKLLADLAFFQMRHETLERIEAGGWWRLRGVLQPALRLYWQLRQRGDRRTCT